MIISPKTITFFDTETTGLLLPMGNDLENFPHIIEIGIITTDKKLNPIDIFQTLIKPPIPIPKHITAITGITNEMVEHCFPFGHFAKEVKKRLLIGQRLVAQNLMFDISIMKTEYARLNQEINFQADLFCTVEQSMHIKGIRMNSSELHTLATGKPITGIHRAKEDCLAMIEYYKYIVNS